MKLTVTGRHLEVTDTARQQIDRKLQKLHRVLNDSAMSAQCVVSRERGQFVCEMSVHARGDHRLHGVGRSTQIATAAALAVAKVGQQAQRLSDRWKTRRRNGNGVAPRAIGTQPATVSEVERRVIRSTRYAVKPMTLDDAVLALADGAQSFLVFRQAGSESVAILYRRPDGHFGLIEPEA
jgi:putative sigma-54 modulation protein